MSHHSIDSTLQKEVTSSSSETLYFMMEQECTTYSTCDYLHDEDDDGSFSDDSNCSTSATIHDRQFSSKGKITPADRLQVTDWCYAIVERCQFQRETVAFAMNIVDRFMSNPRRSTSMSRSQEVDALYDRVEYQLVTVTALYISIKLNEQTTFGSQDFTAASRGTYSLEDIEGMELKILHSLSWRLCPPTSLQVGNQILSLMLAGEASIKLEPGTLDLLQKEVAFQTENAVRDYYFVTHRPSTIAAAAIINAIESVSNHDCGFLTAALISILRTCSFEPAVVLMEVRQHLLRLTSKNNDSQTTALMMPERTRVPPPKEESWIPSEDEESWISSAEEEALNLNDNDTYHSLVQRVQDSYAQTMHSPSLVHVIHSPTLVICDATCDDDSFLTVYP